ncbi:CYTH domain-containing protein [Lutimonas halocynthiae]|uniref:CYTH domain-containing protein n=1 Tax=Lutimonas halocynthiae TaxID=1446477 RepID=UPI0025B4B2B4|nr:CYTH domain-containing protein [Lutimonas halocynthiae]MDN3642314.1 CYTH domain-containing protein [Lutimonas halocynthiae]
MKNLEIERKFLILNNDFKKESYKKERIIQGFLSSVPERTVRVRLTGDAGFITVKGIGNEAGTTRFEWEREISKQEAESLLEICEAGIIDKERYYVKAGEHIFEIDEFELDNKGLVMAEVELKNEEDSFEKPKWLGEEVTGQKKYYNSSLVKNPFQNW